jgi:formylglycine-generating enzyme required for sulfatase activity
MEECNGIDDDCDGIVDNSDPSDPSRVRDPMVHVVQGGLDFWIYTYEASRPDGSATSVGTDGGRACSAPGRLPWTAVAFDDAAAACAAAGHRLCTGAEWQAACEGAMGRTYPYGDAYAGGTCNGADRDAVAGGDIDSRVEPCGTLASCVSEAGALDLSGNVKEWTNDLRGSASGGRGIYVIRGGSVESPRLGLTCDTTLSQATEDTLLPTIGFRCCDDDGP